MNHSSKKPAWTMNERGFTMTELIVGSAISLIMLALVAGVLQSQKSTFTRQSQLGQMQASGRAAVEFVSRSVQNAGYNVTHGKRFLAASDHYLTMVFDDDNDGTIQNDEVMTYAVSTPSGAITENFTISPFFDDDGDGAVDSSETRDYNIALSLTSPPFNFSRITPDAGSASVTNSIVARNIDNLIIRYWDKDGNPLPAGVATDVDGNPVPPYVIPAGELNDIRKVDMDLIALSKDEDPNVNYLNTGTYATGSVATTGGTTSYSDRYHRETYTAVTSPRNLVTAPWGKISMVAANPNVVCPDDSTVVTATVVDGDGDGASATSVSFNTSEGTLNPATSTTGSNGNTSTTLTYDWEQPSVTATISASALIDVDGEGRPVFSAIPVAFTSGTGIFTDDFEDGSAGWTEVGTANWNVASGQYSTASNGPGHSLNGCEAWQDYEAQVEIQRNGSLGTNEYVGLILRYQDSNQYYSATLYCTVCTGNPNNNEHALVLERYDSGVATALGGVTVDFDNNAYYTLKASVEGDEFKAKFWSTGATEPTPWDIERTDTTYSGGEIALTTTKSATKFDNAKVTPIS